MAGIDDGGSAFPLQETESGKLYGSYGMTLRDWFAGQAVVGFLSGGFEVKGSVPGTAQRALSEAAYLVADAMLAERSKTKE